MSTSHIRPEHPISHKIGRYAWLSGLVTYLVFFLAASHAAAPWDPAGVRDYLNGVSSSVRGGSVEAHWHEDGSGFWTAIEEADGEAYYSISLPEGEQTQLTTKAALVQAALAQDLSGEDLKVTSVDKEKGALILHLNGAKWSYAIDTKEFTRIGDINPHGDANIVRQMFPINGWDRREVKSPDGKHLATLIDHDFGLRSAEDGKVRQLTSDGATQDRWFFAGDLWESSGSPWSPDSSKVVARRHNTKGVTGFPIVDYLQTNETVEWFDYWARAGQPLPITSFAIFDAATGEMTPTKTGDDDQHLAFFVDWSPDGEEFVFIRYNRDITKQELVAVNARTGKSRTLVKEKRRDGWVKWPGGTKSLHFLPSGDGFLWRSDRDGWFHWYHYDRKGRLQGQVTQGDHFVGNVVSIDEDGGWLYYIAGSDEGRPWDRHLNRVRLDGTGEAQQLTSLPGQYQAKASPDNAFFLVTHSHLDRPRQTDLITADGEVLSTVAKAHIDEDFRDGWLPPEEVTVKAADGTTDMYGLIMKPPHFDPSKSYPDIERIYGGMQSNVMRRSFVGEGTGYPGGEYQTLLSYLNHLGFVIVMIDAPGTPGRGRAYNLDTHRKWPEGVIADHVAGLRDMAANRPYMDLDRVGVLGNSWGGYIGTRALTDAPEFYKAGSISVPETDLFDHVHWIEFANGDPKTNQEWYEKNGTPALAANIIAPILLIAGTADANVPISNMMKLLDALAEHGKEYDLVLFPGTNHAHQGRGDRYAFAANKIGRFFGAHLGEPQPRQ